MSQDKVLLFVLSSRIFSRPSFDNFSTIFQHFLTYFEFSMHFLYQYYGYEYFDQYYLLKSLLSNECVLIYRINKETVTSLTSSNGSANGRHNSISASNGKNTAPQIIEPQDERLAAPLKISYNMNHNRRGIAVILNHYYFDKSTGLNPRNGTHKDVDALKQTFESLGFHVKVHSDLDLESVFAALKKSKVSFAVLLVICWHVENCCSINVSICSRHKGSHLQRLPSGGRTDAWQTGGIRAWPNPRNQPHNPVPRPNEPYLCAKWDVFDPEAV